MASNKRRLATLKKRSGIYYVRYIADGQGDSRRSFSTGTDSDRDANSICDLVDVILACKRSGRSLPGIEQFKLDEIAVSNRKFYQRLVDHDLAEPIEEPEIEVRTLGELVNKFIETGRSTAKPRTVTTWQQAERLLFERFDRNLPVNEFTRENAIQFRSHLLARTPTDLDPNRKPLAESTTRRRCRCVKQMFAYAVEIDWVSKNPFNTKHVPTSQPRAQDKHYLTPEIAERILEHFPDCRWRLLFTLSRFGGLRVPSELAPLEWSDVDWERGRLRVRSPKTEHHEGHEDRVIPIWPEIMEELQSCWDATEPGEKHVFPMIQDKSNSWCRKYVVQAIKKAKVQTWPKLFNAMRASAIHDARLRGFSKEAIDSWFGNSDKVRVSNYQTTEMGRMIEAEMDRAKTVPRTVPRKSPQQPAGISTKTETPQEVAYDCTEVQQGRPGRTRTRDKGIMSPLL